MTLRILFAGTPEFGAPALTRLIELGHPPCAVLTQPDRPAGRGRQVQFCAIKQHALDHGIEVLQPATLKGVDLSAWSPDLLVTAAYGLLLPKAVLETPRLGCWNLHASLLPRWRGASPIQQAILAGDPRTGISLMQMDEGLDTGPVLMQRALDIGSNETAGELHDRLSRLAGDVLAEAITALKDERLPAPEPQPSEGVCHAPLIKKADAWIDWQQDAASLARAVRAYNPWPIAHTDLFQDRGVASLRIWAAHAIESTPAEGAPPGQLVTDQNHPLVVTCGRGALAIDRLQLPGKRPVLAKDFINAHPDWR